MLNKRKVRELSLQLLFLWDAHGETDQQMTMQITHEASDDPMTRQLANEMASGAWNGRELSDKWVERLAPQWPPRRQPGVDRNILRMAIWEMTTSDTPPKVIIDEAIELAKIYSTENSPAFVNGVLDAVLKEHTEMTNDQTRMTNE